MLKPRCVCIARSNALKREPEQGALFQKALEAAGDQLFAEQQYVPEDVEKEIDTKTPLDSTSPEPVSRKRADQLARVVEGFLAGVGNDRPVNDLSGGDKYMVNIHTDKVNWCAASREGALGYIETLKQDGTGAEAEIKDRSHVPAGTLLRLLREIVRRVWRLRLIRQFRSGMGIGWITRWRWICCCSASESGNQSPVF